MIAKNHKFKQIQTALIAFIGNLELQLQEIKPNLPVFMQHSGDSSYFLDKKFNEIDNKEIYQKIPRFILELEDIQIQTDQYTNKYNVYNYRLNDITYQAKGRRVPLTITVQTNFVSSNFITALENWEIATNILAGINVFTYEFLGNTYEGVFTLGAPSLEKPTMDPNSSTRNYDVKLQLEVSISPLYPKLASIKKLSDVGFTKVNYGLNSLSDTPDASASTETMQTDSDVDFTDDTED